MHQSSLRARHCRPKMNAVLKEVKLQRDSWKQSQISRQGPKTGEGRVGRASEAPTAGSAGAGLYPLGCFRTAQGLVTNADS